MVIHHQISPSHSIRHSFLRRRGTNADAAARSSRDSSGIRTTVTVLPLSEQSQFQETGSAFQHPRAPTLRPRSPDSTYELDAAPRVRVPPFPTENGLTAPSPAGEASDTPCRWATR